MFERDPREATELTRYTGLKIGAILLPMLLFFAYFGKEDMGLAVVIVLGAMMVAIKIRWNLSKHIWFWAIIAVILALHVPLVFKVRWPQGSAPTLFYTLPFGFIDFLIISEGLRLAEKLFAKSSSSSGETG
ncbi:MAG TPA: hypothetical protein VN948_21895 [Terriglobales bacterium]|nr:hypothetical protein [Terriglobales bacterium]